MDAHFAINKPLYQWSVRAFSLLRKRLGMQIEAKAPPGVIDGGQIFLFNHFARFETIIPQYFIYQATGAYCRCVATHELFEGSERFAKLLWGLGGVPSNLPGLLPFLAAEILRGHKVIIFPEGSMMKDRSIAAPPHQNFLQALRPRTGHHQGAAALAVILEVFKKRILSVHEAQDFERLDRWVAALGLSDREALLAAARKPTLIVPSNITFHPLHIGENVLLKAADLLKFNLGGRGRDELQVEGNLILRKTDMDIRFGHPIDPELAWTRADRLGLARIFEQIDSLDDLFGLKDKATAWGDRLANITMTRTMRRLRDMCMVEMYSNVTVNSSQLASALILHLVGAGTTQISQAEFEARLYAIIKGVQKLPALHLHRSVADPREYAGLHKNQSSLLKDFYASASALGLISLEEGQIALLPALQAEIGKRDPRLVNNIRVYANEVASLVGVSQLVAEAVPLRGAGLAHALLDDETRLLQGRAQGHALILPKQVLKHGVVLAHALSRPAQELQDFAQRLADGGHPVLLLSFDTQPDPSMLDGLAQLRCGHEIMAHLAGEVSIVGFASGAALALLHASEKPQGLSSVVAVSTPVKIGAPVNLGLPRQAQSKLLEMADTLRALWRAEPGAVQDRTAEKVLALEQSLVAALPQSLAQVNCPLLLIQSSEDPVIDSASATIIHAQVASVDKRIHRVMSNRHAILHENIGDTQDVILGHLAELSGLAQVPAVPRAKWRRMPEWRILRWAGGRRAAAAEKHQPAGQS